MNSRQHIMLASHLLGLTIMIMSAQAGADSRRLSDIRTSPCPSNSNLDGHQDVASFVEDMENGATEFLLCPDILYGEGLVIPSTQSFIDITCLNTDAKCVWEISEGSHLVIEESVSVTVTDVLFKGATNSSIQLKQPGGPEVQFSGCEWQENQGLAVIEAANSSAVSDNSTGLRLLQSGDNSEFGQQVTIAECLFQNNSVEGSLVFTDTVNLRIENTIFFDNVANVSVIDLQQGFHEFNTLAFESNDVAGIGLVYLSANARLNQSDICGSGNNAGPICNGTFLQVGNPDQCGSDNQISCSPGCATYLPCDDNQDCVASSENLRISLENGGDIQLCSDTTINLDDVTEPLEIAERPVSITCDSNCTIEGGRIQLRIVDGATDVIFDGVEFSGSEEMSLQIEVDPTAPSTISFRNCEWRNHQGNHVILTAVEGDLDDDDTIEAALQITGSRFVGNDVSRAVVENRDLSLKIEECIFELNICQAIIGVVGGLNQVDDSLFENNAVRNTVLAVGIDAREFMTGTICGSNNTDSSACNGTLYQAADPAGCREDDQDEEACAVVCSPLAQCDVSPSDCYSTYAGLQGALESSQGGTFVVCPNSRITLDDGDEAIEISDPGTIIKCGNDGSISNSCAFVGGLKQIVVNTDMVSVFGLMFSDSTFASVQVLVDPATQSSVAFNDCSWSNNNGVYTIDITTSVRADLLSRLRHLQDGPASSSESKVTIVNSTFIGNIATSSIIANAASTLFVYDSKFFNNQAGRSIVSLDVGNSTIADVRFVDNTINNGVVFIGVGASLNRTDDMPICGMNNTAGQIPCDGILLETIDFDECVNGNLDACRAACSSLASCEGDEACYSEWSLLTNSVRETLGGKTFVVCPETEFSLTSDDDPLLLSMNDTILRCGDGRRENQCVVFGGENQLIINGTVTGLQVEGFTFVGSSNICVTAMGDGDSAASFIDCEFTGHRGDAVVLLLSFYDAERLLLPGGEGDAPSTSSMYVAIDSCLFDDNAVALSPVVNMQGVLNVSSTAFNGNSGVGGSGAIAALFEARLELSSSCFVKNNGNVSGAILLSEEASLEFQQTGSFGDENVVLNGNCTDILSDGDQISCDNFGASECFLESSITSAPSNEQPSEPPLMIPTISAAPSPASADETDPPTSAPTIVGSCFDASEWETFFGAVRESEGDEVFTICANTTINMTEMEEIELAPLLIRASGITIQCASRRRSSCVLTGGTSHVLLRSSIERVNVKYITMEEASGVSVAGSISVPFSVEFENCFWSNNTGVSTIVIIGESSGENDTAGGRGLQNADDNFFVCDRCSFEQNSASDAIVYAAGTTLIIEATDFQKNTAGQSLISVEQGSMVLSDSCIVDSELSSGSALLSVDDASASTTGLYLQENGQSSCSGYIDESDNCVQSDTSSSCIAAEKRCYSHWEDLSYAISQLSEVDGDSKITLCENSRLDVSGLEPIEISRSKTTIRCGQNGARTNNCLVFGGGVQFAVVGTPLDVIFSGITFSSASITAVHAAGERSGRGQILDCAFNDMVTGPAAVLIYGGEIPSSTRNRRKLVVDDYTEPSNGSMTLEIKYCAFSGVGVEVAPVANFQGTLIVLDSLFDGNSGIAGGIGEWLSGSTSLSNSCFTGSTGESAGSVYIDGDSATENNNYSNGNTVDGDCTDLYISEAAGAGGGSEGLCVEFVATECDAEEAPSVAPTSAPTLPNQPTADFSPAPTRKPIDCIRSWEDLANEIAFNYSAGVENVFTICPDETLLVGDEPIMLNQTNGDILIECGLNGRLRDNCSISGGRAHFRITGEAIEVTFRGIKLKGSTEVSILAGADKESSVRFAECEWTDNTGLLAVLIFSEAEGEFDVRTPVSELPSSVNCMSATFEECLFSDNPLTQAVVSSLGGKMSFSLTAFDRHMEISTGTIVARGEALVSVSQCCFVENDSNLPGTIYFSEQSELTKNEENFGFDNRVGLTSCTDIFMLAPGEECSSSSCAGICSIFDGRSCSIPDYEYNAPSTAPSDTPIEDPTGNTPSSAVFAFEETSLLGSSYFLRNLVVASIVAVLGFASFFYCKSQQGKPLKSVTKESAPILENNIYHQNGEDVPVDGMMMDYDAVVTNADTTEKKEKKPNRGGFFGRGSKKQKEDSEELAPMVADGVIVSSPSFRVGNGDHMDQDIRDSRFHNHDDGIELS